MKLSVSWLFDHLKGNWRSYDMNDLTANIVETVAEVDHAERISLNPDNFFLAKILKITNDGVTVSCPELKKEYTLPARKQTPMELSHYYLLVRESKSQMRWATLADMGSSKDGSMPAVWCSEVDSKGQWKKLVEWEDIIITVDNKSLTDRPDLWGHRGFARELAALYGLQLVAEDHILAHIPIRHYDRQAPITTIFPLEVAIEDPVRCKRLAVFDLKNITYRPSLIPMALRLARVDARPHDALVDMTNYVMYDIGQPMHAFDAAPVKNRLVARHAEEGEKLVTLDGDTLELTTYDLVVADGDRALALAGVIGGRETAISPTTTSVILEAANFDAATIRATVSRYKKRTEAAIRFEKSLDPNQNTQAIARFVKLLDDAHIPYEASDAMISVGPLVEEQIIEITHDDIIQRLGVTMSPEKIADTLQLLGFGVQITDNNVYRIVVPTYRLSKQDTIKEDIIDEVGRSFGYRNIPAKLPHLAMQALNHKKLLAKRALKQHCAFALSMHEVVNYALYDEEFLRLINYEPHNAPSIKNPVSQDARRLVTSLIPHLLKNIVHNSVGRDAISFFEVARTWTLAAPRVIERATLAGVFFTKKSLNFYHNKAQVQSVFDMLGCPVSWRKAPHAGSLFDHNQTASIWLDDLLVGYAGIIKPALLINALEGEVFAFELDAALLMQYEPEQKQFTPLPRYQTVSLDISILAPASLTVDELQQTIAEADPYIRTVTLIDFFQKPQWHDQRSITFRFVLVDEHKTMTKEEIDLVWQRVVELVQSKGGQIR